MQIARSWKDVSFILQHKKVSSLMIFPTILYMSAFYIFFTIKLVNCPFIILSPNWPYGEIHTEWFKSALTVIQMVKNIGKIYYSFRKYLAKFVSFFNSFLSQLLPYSRQLVGLIKITKNLKKERNLVSSWHRWILLHQKTTDITTTSLLPTNYFIFILNIFE